MTAGHIQETADRKYIVAKDGEIKTVSTLREAIFLAEEGNQFGYTPYQDEKAEHTILPRK